MGRDVPEPVFHIFMDNDASSVEKYKTCLTRKQYLIDMR